MEQTRSERIETVAKVLRGPSLGGVEGLAQRIVDALFVGPPSANVWVRNAVRPVAMDSQRTYLRAITILREHTGISLREAKDRIDATPGFVAHGLPEPVAEQLIGDLFECGTIAEIRKLGMVSR